MDLTNGGKNKSSQTQTKSRQPAPKVCAERVYAFTPAFAWYTDNVLFGEIYERTELPQRDRSLIVVASLITLGRMPQLKGHFNRGLTYGIRPTEIAEIVTHLAFYSGWPCSMSAVEVMQEVFTARNIGTDQIAQSTSEGLPMPADEVETTRKAGAIAPAFGELTERVLQGDLWKRSELTPRDRSLVTIASLVAQGQMDQLGDHVKLGLKNGLTKTEIVEAVLHLAFYVGWPKAASAFPVVKAAF